LGKGFFSTVIIATCKTAVSCKKTVYTKLLKPSLPERIHAHASICFMALILHRVMRSRLKDSHSQISPERALDKLRRIQHQVVKVNDLDPIAALSNINQEHTAILQALTIKKDRPFPPS
jgi:hypothetical protein